MHILFNTSTTTMEVNFSSNASTSDALSSSSTTKPNIWIPLTKMNYSSEKEPALMENPVGSIEPQYDSGEIAFLMACVAVTFIMIPGVGFFYNGMARSKSSLSLIMLCLWTCAAVSIQWYIIGFSLCLSEKGGPFIGSLHHVFLMDTDVPYTLNPKIPTLLASSWYGIFSVITPTIILGGVAERTRFIPTVVFVVLWSTFVFDFLTYWTWNLNGWTYKLGALDFGGGTPVHLSTGAAALAFAYMVGKRKDPEERLPHNMTHVILGTSFIWMGWLVANAGSGISAHQRAVTVLVTTNLSASVGGITWGMLDYFRHGRKWSAVGFCAGAVCGLVAITPASGYVTPSSSLVFGFLGSLICNFSMNVKHCLRVDDTFDVFTVHGIGGVVGNILTGVFAQKSVAAVDGTVIEGGWLDGNWKQVGIQGIDTVAGMGWAFFVTAAILWIIDKIPGLHIRADPEDEMNGLDRAELGVSMYEHIEELKSTITLQSTMMLHKDSGEPPENGQETKNGADLKDLLKSKTDKRCKKEDDAVNGDALEMTEHS